jgi:hypothetical protein
VPTEDQLNAELAQLNAELDRRGRRYRLLDSYYEASAAVPAAVARARVVQAYRMLMPVASAPWGSLVVDSVQDRLEVAGIRSDLPAVDKQVWRVWQDNQMDSESKLAHNSALLSGRAFALVWPGATGQPEISLDSAEQMIVRYREGSRRQRVAALRRWMDGDTPNVTLYRPDAIYKFQGPKNSSGMAGTQWQRREVPGEEWPLPNPLNVVPVVEIALNRRLKPGSFGYARGEFEHCIGLIDRINLLTFLGLVVAFWMGFPLRGVIGERIILATTTATPCPPSRSTRTPSSSSRTPRPSSPSTRRPTARTSASSPSSTSSSTITKTPRHYFPLEQGMSNLAADAIRASEGALHAKVTAHKASAGEGWEEVLRLAGRMLDQPVDLPADAALLWKDHESRSLAERADAATKLKDLVPWQSIAETVLNASQDDIKRWGDQRAADMRANGVLELFRAATAVQPPASS